MNDLSKFEEIDFHKYLQVLQRRWIPGAGVFGAVVTLASLNALSLKPTYKAEANLLIKTNQTSSLTGLGEAIGAIGRLESLGLTNNPLDTQAKIVASVPVIEETIHSLALKDDKGKELKIRDFTKRLKTESVKGTDILQISYTDKNPNLAAEVVNKVIEIYIRNNIEANRAETASAGKFIKQQLPDTEDAVRRAETALRRFKEKNKVIVLQEEATASVNRISKLEEEISQAQAQLVDVTAQSQKLQNQAKINSQQAVNVAQLSQIPGTQKLLEQLQEAQSQLAVEQTRLQPEHPTIINLSEKIAALKSLLQQRTEQVLGSKQQVSISNLQIGELRQKLIEDFARSEAKRVGLERQITTLSNERSAYKERANILPQLEQTQRQLERRLKAAQTTYETLLTRLQEVRVAENQNIGNARVISAALVPDLPSGSQKKLIIGGGAVAGILLGVIAAFSLDVIDRSVKTVKEARELFQYTLLGVIPSVTKSGKKSNSLPKVIGRDIPHFPVGDAYQMLQANLKFLSSDKKPKAIVVTSSASKEGKSEVAANLAVAMAQVGCRVLLVDADMRHPVQHHVWEMTNAVGLSNVIVEQLPIDRAVQEVMPNLYVLPSGVLPPNPVALLDSKRMAALVASFAEEYDFVIFDTPTLAGTADAAVLSKLSDGILLVVRPGVSDYGSANAAKEFLNQSGQNVLGMVINGVNVKREPDSYFYYTKDSAEAGFAPGNSVLTEINTSGFIRKEDV
ncbi:lipopolysaccharide biosynthesis protein [Brasilonema octagenarum UFV-E1]|uniref:non-specific protein-tyrosine kinase n=1 Tax=Brasilonema sennae CENA114 TaxID=415709 RepID=A0A856M7Y4_9CYAN|nr:polysaccharide biosynthesis tyrosine autokinase [Brasilonema sennae]QDL07253.1 lipopolysaccharide biosynthesis protein [Brasilonema sennae CENA114]QDL13616.1 lipopolysaccharide biosynthesis protein [Brasilonema octagenarum UFV-E1]